MLLNIAFALAPVLAFLLALQLMDSFKLVRPSSVAAAIVAGAVAALAAWGLHDPLQHLTGSSDAHHAKLVGTTWTDFDGTDGAALRRAIAGRTTRPDGRHWTLGEHLDGVAQQQWRSMVRDPVKRARRQIKKRQR